MGLLKRGKRTAAVTNAIKEDERKIALKAMTEAGRELVTVKDIIITK
jgi:hypothetical protein